MVKGMFIGEICRRAECTPRTVRFYEEKGLLGPVAKTSGGKKLYPPETVSIIRMVQVLTKVGYSIADVQELLSLSQSSKTKNRRLTIELRETLKNIQHSLELKITELSDALQQIRKVLQESEACEDCASKDCVDCKRLFQLRTLGFLPENKIGKEKKDA